MSTGYMKARHKMNDDFDKKCPMKQMTGKLREMVNMLEYSETVCTNILRCVRRQKETISTNFHEMHK